MNLLLVLCIIVASTDFSTGQSVDYAKICPKSAVEKFPQNKFLDLDYDEDYCLLFFVNQSVNYQDAEKSCSDLGGTLAMPKFKYLTEQLAAKLERLELDESDFAWVGIKSNSSQGGYRFVDGTRLHERDTDNFRRRPNSQSTGGKDCVGVNTESKWDAFSCDLKKPYVCRLGGPQEKSLTVKEACPKAALADYDEDFFGIFNNTHCFLYVTNLESNFAEAERVCEGYGGTLAMPKNDYINHHLGGSLAYFFETHDNFWIGINDRETEGTYRFADGTLVEDRGFFKWPSNPFTQRSEDCVSLGPVWQLFGSKGYYWRRKSCGTELPFVCQFEIN